MHLGLKKNWQLSVGYMLQLKHHQTQRFAKAVRFAKVSIYEFRQYVWHM